MEGSDPLGGARRNEQGTKRVGWKAHPRAIRRRLTFKSAQINSNLSTSPQLILLTPIHPLKQQQV